MTSEQLPSRRTFLSVCAALLVFVSVGAAAEPAPEREQRRFEIEFLTMMIDHHFGAVKMAELCDGRTVHTDLLNLCHQIKTAQTAEIAMLQGWLQNWYGVSHAPELDRKMQQQVDRLSELTGAAFEKTFMAIMIRHHAAAVDRGREALLKAWHAELLNMAAKMIGDQGDEIAMMRIWLIQWYGVQNLDHDHP